MKLTKRIKGVDYDVMHKMEATPMVIPRPFASGLMSYKFDASMFLKAAATLNGSEKLPEVNRSLDSIKWINGEVKQSSGDTSKEVPVKVEVKKESQGRKPEEEPQPTASDDKSNVSPVKPPPQSSDRVAESSHIVQEPSQDRSSDAWSCSSSSSLSSSRSCSPHSSKVDTARPQTAVSSANTEKTTQEVEDDAVFDCEYCGCAFINYQVIKLMKREDVMD